MHSTWHLPSCYGLGIESSVELIRRLVHVALILLAISGCAEDQCASEPPSFQVDINIAPVQTVASLVIELEIEGRTFRRTFTLDGDLDDGQTAFAVDVEPPPSGSFDVRMSAQAYRGPDATSLLVGQARRQFRASPDGCNLVSLELEPEEIPPDGGLADAGSMPDASVDASVPDGGIEDVGPGPTDAGEPDAGIIPVECPLQDPDVVGLYPFNGNFDDAIGQNDAEFEIGNPTGFITGADGCGLGVRFTAMVDDPGYIVIDDDNAWRLREGSVDFVVRAPSEISPGKGLLSRDAEGFNHGEFDVRIACDGTVVAKLEDNSQAVYRCSEDVLPRDQWVHVGVNFGDLGFELYVNGVPATRTGTIACNMDIDCGGSTTIGIRRSREPWVIGASTEGSEPESTMPINNFFEGGDIDHLRISQIRRDF